VSCQPTCDGFNEVIYCTGDPTVCEANRTCNPSNFLGMPYAYCG
jgi:hypothetical protein